MRAILGALLIAACAGSAAAANAADFGNWATTCDGGGGCSAWAWGESWGSPGYVVLNIDPSGRRTLLFSAGGYSDKPRKDVVQFRVRIVGRDGDVLWSRTFPSRSWYPATVVGRLETSSEIDTALRALNVGDRVRFDVVGETTAFTFVSLKGSAASLLWLADQRKVAPTTPVIRRAAKVSQVGIPSPAPAAIPRCDDDPQGERLTSNRLAPGKVLWIANCDFGSPYNLGALVTLTDETGRVLPGPMIDPYPGPDPDDLDLGNLSYDSATRTLTSISYGSGMRTCGVSTAWVWDGQAFRMAKTAGATECEGLAEKDWPVTYRARIVDR